LKLDFDCATSCRINFVHRRVGPIRVVPLPLASMGGTRQSVGVIPFAQRDAALAARLTAQFFAPRGALPHQLA
jgi:hypothetical protein